MTSTNMLGSALVAYMLNVDTADLQTLSSGGPDLTAGQQASWSALSFALVTVFDGATSLVEIGERLRHILMVQDDDGSTVARQLHRQAGGSEPTIVGDDDLETALIAMAVDAYPAFLLPPDAYSRIPRIGPPIEVVQLLHRHPQSQVFQSAALNSADLSRVFPPADEPTDIEAWVWRNTGAGSLVQLVMLPSIILEAAWRQVKHDNPDTVALANAALDELRRCRTLLTGGRSNSTTHCAFTGILLPDGIGQVQFGNVMLEAVTVADRELAPELLNQQFTGADSAGRTTVINYDGDLVARLPFELRTRVTRPPAPGTIDDFPADMHEPEHVEHRVECLRLSLLLAVERDAPAQLLPTWRYYDDPFSHGHATLWSDPRFGASIVPITLTETEVQSWVRWHEALSRPSVTRIGVAITRILKAVAERREPADVLIDSVIAWENIFGTRDGEPTLRITTALAVLLEAQFAERATLRSRLSRIYDLRSDVVHGNRSLKFDDYPLCHEALTIAMRAVRILVQDRTDILDLADGAARSNRLLLGG